MRKKMVLIGAGSAMFTHGLVIDLMGNSGDMKWHLALVDIDKEALDSSSKLVEKLIKARNYDLELSYSVDRCDVLPGADYVVTTIGVGGRRAWEQDVYIPRKYGVYQPVGDTAMPGGISRAMRMIPAMLDIINDVSRLCPNACFFNYSNPMAIICRAIRKATPFPVVGLCHGVNSMEGYLAQFAGVDRKKLTTRSVGINHLTFMYDIRYQGKDIKPLLKEKLKGITQPELDEVTFDRFFAPQEGGFVVGEPFSWEIFEDYGAFPAPGDRHIVEFFTERFPQGKYYGKTLGVDVHGFEHVIKWGDEIYEEIKATANSSDPLPEKYLDRTIGEHELLIDMIHSIENDERKVFSVNVPNEGAIPNLPKDAVLEIPAVATAKGFAPLHLNDFPDVLAGIIAKNLAIIEVTADAALKGDRKLFEEAILMGGYISDRSAVIKMVDELIKAQAKYLPQFK